MACDKLNDQGQPRHELSCASKSAAEAIGRCYVQIFGTCDAAAPFADVTGYYDFTAAKLGGVWRFGRWIHKVEQASV